MDAADDHDDDEFKPPLPMEDRLWRHPSEVAAEHRATADLQAVEARNAEVTVSTLRTPWRQGVALASLGAIGGALIVTGLFLTLGSTTAASPTAAETTFSTLALDPIVPVTRQVASDRWPAEVVSSTQSGVVRLDATTDGATTTGSAVSFRSDGLLLTSHQLVADAGRIDVVMADGSQHEGAVLGTDAISGLAVVKIDHHDIPTAPLAIFKRPVDIGDYTVAVAGLAPAESLELVRLSARAVNVPLDENHNLHGLLQLDGGMPEGASGGAVVDDAGAVIGIIIDMDTTNATYAVPIGYARKIADDLVRYGQAKHPWLGIKGVDLSDTHAAELGVDGAIRVTAVIEDSPAAEAGVRKGDVIVAIDDDDVLSMSELILELRNHPPGDDIIIEIRRDGVAAQKPTVLAVRHVGNST